MWRYSNLFDWFICYFNVGYFMSGCGIEQIDMVFCIISDEVFVAVFGLDCSNCYFFIQGQGMDFC